MLYRIKFRYTYLFIFLFLEYKLFWFLTVLKSVTGKMLPCHQKIFTRNWQIYKLYHCFERKIKKRFTFVWNNSPGPGIWSMWRLEPSKSEPGTQPVNSAMYSSVSPTKLKSGLWNTIINTFFNSIICYPLRRAFITWIW